MSRNPSAMRYDPGGRLPGQATDGRRRVLVLGAGALLVALAGASVANAQHASLRCEGGLLIPYGGRLLPLGEVPIDDADLPPLVVPPAECEDESFESRAELRERYRELTVSWADAAIQSKEPSALQTSLDALQGLSDDDDGVLTPRYRRILEAVLHHEVQQARDSHDQARRRLEQARKAGVRQDAIRAAESTLDSLHGTASVEAAPQPAESAPTPPSAPPPIPPAPAPPTTTSRSL